MLRKHILVDGFDFVLDLEKSKGSRLVDAVSGRSYLDLYSFFASSPLGMNPADMAEDPEFVQRLTTAAMNKPSNSDVYTAYYAEFVDTFARVMGDPQLPLLFFVEGGALAVENALKCAFDWKSRMNEAAGRSPALGTKVLHLCGAFHGRSGYTLSLTNTDPAKTRRFPKFDWPRITAPTMAFPPDDAAVAELERCSLAEAREAFARYPHDIACFIAEPIQGEGGDNHFRAEFLQAMQRLCRENDCLFVVDEVQTGMGVTGTNWAYQQLGLEPDVVAFAKKAQLGGIMAGRRVFEVPDNVFAVSSRINSTWGGSLVDMVRCTRILEVIERDGLVERAARVGSELLEGLRGIEQRAGGFVGNTRGRGLMCAFDVPSPRERDAVVESLRDDEQLLVVPAGARTVRLRPVLSVEEQEIFEALAAVARVADRHVSRSTVHG